MIDLPTLKRVNSAWVSAGILKAGGKIRNEALVAEGLPSLNREMILGGITNPRRIAAFLATIAVESEFEYNRPQDGATSKYKGRGYIQLTGSANYESASNFIGVNLLVNPELALDIRYSAKIARWYWTKARPSTNAYADALRMGMVDKMIGFPAGPADEVRARMFAEALRVLTGSVPPGITSTRDTAPPAPQFTTTEKLGQWKSGDFLVNQNVFSKEAGTQTLAVYGPGSWSVLADHSRTDVPPGAIKAYPDTQRNFTGRTIDSFKTITATYDMTCPPVGEWDAAFDVWVGGIGSKSTAEVMVWTHHRYNGVLPPKNATEKTTVTIEGQSYVAWWRLNGNGGRYIALVMDPKKPAGSVNLLSIFHWLCDKSWLNAKDVIAAIEYGVEIANTPAGSPQTFRLNQYTLTAE